MVLVLFISGACADDAGEHPGVDEDPGADKDFGAGFEEAPFKLYTSWFSAYQPRKMGMKEMAALQIQAPATQKKKKEKKREKNKEWKNDLCL